MNIGNGSEGTSSSSLGKSMGAVEDFRKGFRCGTSFLTEFTIIG